jgi:hypothetical protein
LKTTPEIQAEAERQEEKLKELKKWCEEGGKL